MELIALKNIHFAYDGRPPTLRGADLTICSGERVGLVGGNGSGKSTLLHLIVGLLRPDIGELVAFGQPRRGERDFREVRCRAGLVFQHADDQLFCPTVLEDVAFGPLNLGKTPDEARRIAVTALEHVGMAGFEERITYRLSGGEKRLCAIATVLAMEPDVLLLDEPTAGLDKQATARLRDVLAALPQAMVIVSHEHGFVDDLVTRCVQLEDGVIRPCELDAAD